MRAELRAAEMEQTQESVGIRVEVGGGSSHEQAMVAASVTGDAAGHVAVGVLSARADAESNADGIAVEVVLEDARPDVAGAQLVSLGNKGLDEDPSSGLINVGAVNIAGLRESSNVVMNANAGHTDQIGESGVEEREAVTVGDAEPVDNSVSVLADVQGLRDADEAEKEEFDTSAVSEDEIVIPIPNLEEVREVIILEESPSPSGHEEGGVEQQTAAGQAPEEGLIIGASELRNDGEETSADLAAEGGDALGPGDASIAIRSTEQVEVAATAHRTVPTSGDHVMEDLLERVSIQSVVPQEAIGACDLSTSALRYACAEASTIVAELGVPPPSEEMEVDGLAALVQPLGSGVEPDGSHRLMSASGEVTADKPSVVVVLDTLVIEETKTEELLDPVAVSREALNASDFLNSNDMKMSVEENSNVVGLSQEPVKGPFDELVESVQLAETSANAVELDILASEKITAENLADAAPAELSGQELNASDYFALVEMEIPAEPNSVVLELNCSDAVMTMEDLDDGMSNGVEELNSGDDGEGGSVASVGNHIGGQSVPTHYPEVDSAVVGSRPPEEPRALVGQLDSSAVEIPDIGAEELSIVGEVGGALVDTRPQESGALASVLNSSDLKLLDKGETAADEPSIVGKLGGGTAVGTRPSEEPSRTLTGSVLDSSDIETPGVLDASAREEPSIVGERGTSSTASIITMDETTESQKQKPALPVHLQGGASDAKVPAEIAMAIPTEATITEQAGLLHGIPCVSVETTEIVSSHAEITEDTTECIAMAILTEEIDREQAGLLHGIPSVPVKSTEIVSSSPTGNGEITEGNTEDITMAILTEENTTEQAGLLHEMPWVVVSVESTEIVSSGTTAHGEITADPAGEVATATMREENLTEQAELLHGMPSVVVSVESTEILSSSTTSHGEVTEDTTEETATAILTEENITQQAGLSKGMPCVVASAESTEIVISSTTGHGKITEDHTEEIAAAILREENLTERAGFFQGMPSVVARDESTQIVSSSTTGHGKITEDPTEEFATAILREENVTEQVDVVHGMPSVANGHGAITQDTTEVILSLPMETCVATVEEKETIAVVSIEIVCSSTTGRGEITQDTTEVILSVPMETCMGTVEEKERIAAESTEIVSSSTTDRGDIKQDATEVILSVPMETCVGTVEEKERIAESAVVEKVEETTENGMETESAGKTEEAVKFEDMIPAVTVFTEEKRDDSITSIDTLLARETVMEEAAVSSDQSIPEQFVSAAFDNTTSINPVFAREAVMAETAVSSDQSIPEQFVPSAVMDLTLEVDVVHGDTTEGAVHSPPGTDGGNEGHARVLKGAGSAVEERGLRIIEITGSAALVAEEHPLAECQFLSEPLITPPAEGENTAINDSSAAAAAADHGLEREDLEDWVILEEDAGKGIELKAGSQTASVDSEPPPLETQMQQEIVNVGTVAALEESLNTIETSQIVVTAVVHLGPDKQLVADDDMRLKSAQETTEENQQLPIDVAGIPPKLETIHEIADGVASAVEECTEKGVLQTRETTEENQQLPIDLAGLPPKLETIHEIVEGVDSAAEEYTEKGGLQTRETNEESQQLSIDVAGIPPKLDSIPEIAEGLASAVKEYTEKRGPQTRGTTEESQQLPTDVAGIPPKLDSIPEIAEGLASAVEEYTEKGGLQMKETAEESQQLPIDVTGIPPKLNSIPEISEGFAAAVEEYTEKGGPETTPDIENFPPTVIDGSTEGLLVSDIAEGVAAAVEEYTEKGGLRTIPEIENFSTREDIGGSTEGFLAAAADPDKNAISVDIPESLVPPVEEGSSNSMAGVEPQRLDGEGESSRFAKAEELGLAMAEKAKDSDQEGPLTAGSSSRFAKAEELGLAMAESAKDSDQADPLPAGSVAGLAVEMVSDGREDGSSSRGQAVEKSERKRGREEEDAGLDEDADEKTSKTSKKIANGEAVFVKENDDTEIGVNPVDVKLEKKRSRDEADSLGPADLQLNTKAPKTGIVDNDETEPGTDITEVVDIEVKKQGNKDSASTPRYKRRKIALFLGYCGVGYQGMQKNPGAITIEGELEDALYRSGAISESNYGEPKKVDWRRAARTDKGVSAVGQVVSGCFVIDPPGLVERVNSHLPKQIRVYGYKRATAGFNCKKLCDRRKYEYVLPVYAFDPSVHLDRESARAQAVAQETEISDATSVKTSGASVIINNEVKESVVEGKGMLAAAAVDANSAGGTQGLDKEHEEVNVSISEKEMVSEKVELALDEKVKLVTETVVALTEVMISAEEGKASDVEAKEVTEIQMSAEEKKQFLDEKVRKSTFKFDGEVSKRLNRILKSFVGHHNFHNFTARTKAEDPSANRYILSFDAEKVFAVDGTEFVRCTVVGQSFMLHQIRKMIGLAVAIMRGCAPESIVATALRRDTKVNVPMAPELGLFLEECYFSSYNSKWHATHEEISLNSYAKDADEFKKEFIYPHIVSTESKDSTFALWLHSINYRHFPDLMGAQITDNVAN